MRCTRCNKNKAQTHPFFGVLPCKPCQRLETDKPQTKYEMTTDSVRDSRKEYAKDVIQPFRDGILSKEYLQEYGTTGLDVTDSDIKNAENVWDDLPSKWSRDKSKGGHGEKWKQKNVKKEHRKE